MVNSISKEKYNDENQVKLLNNLNAELTVMRNKMVYTGLESVKYNLNHRNKNCKFFELGKSYSVDGEGFKEEEKLVLWATGSVANGNWIQKDQAVDFFFIKSIVGNILSLSGLKKLKVSSIEGGLFVAGQQIGNGNQSLVQYGLLSQEVLDKLEIKEAVYYAEFEWERILKLAGRVKPKFSPLPKYPFMKRDLALLVDQHTEFESIKAIAKKYGKQLIRDIDLFDVYQDKKMDADKKSYAISFIFRDDHKTLSDKEVDKVMNKLIEAYKNES